MSGIQGTYQQSPYLGRPLLTLPLSATPPENSAPITPLSTYSSDQNSNSLNTTDLVVGAVVGTALLLTAIGGIYYALSEETTVSPAKTTSTKRAPAEESTGNQKPVRPDGEQSMSGQTPPENEPYVLKYCVGPTKAITTSELLMLLQTRKERPAEPLPGEKNVFYAISDEVTREGASRGRLFDAYQKPGIDLYLYDEIEERKKPESAVYNVVDNVVGKPLRPINVSSPQWAPEPPSDLGTALLPVKEDEDSTKYGKVTAWWEKISPEECREIESVRTIHKPELEDRLVSQIVLNLSPYLRRTLSYRDGFQQEATPEERAKLIHLFA